MRQIRLNLPIKLTTLSLVLLANYVSWSQSVPDRAQLFIGGGALSEDLYQEFADLAGPETMLVVIPTASSREPDIQKITERWQSRGIKHITVLHTRDREVSLNREFADPLKQATAIWFNGGSQSRIADAYLDTPVEEAIYELQMRGGLTGGSSAGAAIMSKMMISGGKSEPEMSTGFDLLPGVILDQHFLKRNRLSRLIAAVRANPDLIGLGIDESTAVIASENELTVSGDSYVMRIAMVGWQLKIDSFRDGQKIPLTQ